MMQFAAGDSVCVDITAARQIPIDGFEAMTTRDIPDIWLAGRVVAVRADGEIEVDIAGPEEAGPARFIAPSGAVRRPLADGTCGEQPEGERQS